MIDEDKVIMTQTPRTYRKCPECGSRHYKRGHTIDVDYIHDPPKPVQRIVDDTNMPWIFKCLDCGYEEPDW